jgi:hypothetical protein
MAIIAVLPSSGHLLALALALVGITDPAIWIANKLSVGPWSVPLLWALVIGGPLLSVLMCLTLEVQHGKMGTLGRKIGMLAWAVLIVGLATTLPMPWILIFE